MQSQLTPPEVIEEEKQIVQRLAGLANPYEIMLVDTGWDSRVYNIKNGESIVKFPRSEKIRSRYASQIAAMRLAYETAQAVSIPNIIWTHPDNHYFGYKGIKGIPLAATLTQLTPEKRKQVGTALGIFLAGFHHGHLDGVRDLNIEEEIAHLRNWYEQGRAQFDPFFTPDQQHVLHHNVYEEWPRTLQRLGSDTRLCHGDLSLQNIFYAPNGQVGVIDFGDVCTADRSKDFIHLSDTDIFEAALMAYGSADDQLLRQKIALRQQMHQVIKLTAQVHKSQFADAHRTAEDIKQFLAA